MWNHLKNAYLLNGVVIFCVNLRCHIISVVWHLGFMQNIAPSAHLSFEWCINVFVWRISCRLYNSAGQMWHPSVLCFHKVAASPGWVSVCAQYMTSVAGVWAPQYPSLASFVGSLMLIFLSGALEKCFFSNSKHIFLFYRSYWFAYSSRCKL